MKALIVGGGGREHALAWKVAQSPQIERVYVAPGNAGTAAEPGVVNLDIRADDTSALRDFALAESIGLTIVGPEVPLVAGLVDSFASAGLPCFGPTRRAAELEGSKAFAKAFLERHGIPTATAAVFTDVAAALDHVRSRGAPLVIKADGLAAGKGVILADDLDTAEQAVRDILSGNRFGQAGSRLVIEERLQGEEVSFIALVADGHFLPLATSQDHKARDAGDRGPNTGGMGAYSPAPVVTPALHARILEQVLAPTVTGLVADGIPYVGFLYAGLMITPDGTPKVLEFNCRLGDPETQPLLMRLRSDLVTLILAALAGRLTQQQVVWDPRPALGVVMAAAGYPDQPATGQVIQGLDAANATGAKVFHAGTRRIADQVVTDGGRVLCVTALGDSTGAAQQLAYQAVDQIHWDGVFCRRDIGYRAIAREQASASTSAGSSAAS